MTKKKVFYWLMALAMMIPMFLGGIAAMGAEGDLVDADPAEVTITLHKKMFEEKLPDEKANSGLLDDDFGGDPLPGAKFALYNVTKEANKLMTAGSTGAQAIATLRAAAIAIENGAPTTYADFAAMGTLVKDVVTAEHTGQAAFGTLPAKTNVGTDTEPKMVHSVYMFIETDAPANVTAHALPMLISLPLTTEVGTPAVTKYLKNIHLYPKDAVSEDGKDITSEDLGEMVEIPDGEGKKEVHNVEIGKVIDYAFTLNIPRLAIKDSFVFTDTPSKGLELTGDVTITGTTMTEGEGYTITKGTPEGGFTINFDVDHPNFIADRGKTLTISYKMVVTADAEPDKTMTNKGSVKVNNDPAVDYEPEELITGGYGFIKQDGNTGAKLEGVEFNILDGTTALKFSPVLDDADEAIPGEYYLDPAGDASLLTGPGGKLKIKGLEYGDYEIEEITTNAGYILLDAPLPFTIAFGSGSATFEIDNIQEGVLPSTGGSGIYIFLLVGGLLMAGAFIWYKKSHVAEEA